MEAPVQGQAHIYSQKDNLLIMLMLMLLYHVFDFIIIEAG